MSEHKRKKDWQAKPNPASIDECFNRAVGCHQKGDLAQAEKGYREVLASAPNHVAALHLIGVVMLQTGRLASGVEWIDKALAIKPDHLDALNNRGNALTDLKRPQEALLSFDKALAIKPEFAEAWSNRGIALQELKRFEEAAACYDKALAIKPNYLEALNNRGAALRSLDRFEEAVACYDQALAIKPNFPDALNNRGNALKELRRFEEALVSYDRALAIKPDFADALSNRGGVLKELKRFKEALVSYDRALAIKPDFAEAIFNRAITRLLLGDFAGGWPGYESRWDRKESSKRKLEASCPVWRGEPISRRRIIVYEEQGLGDIIQFSRYLRLLSQAGAEVTFLLRTRMHKLMGGLDETVIVTDHPSGETFDYQCALMSLPLVFGTTLANVPAETPYLRADPERARIWRARIGDEGFKIGVAWQGNKAGKIDAGRSFALAHCLGVSQIPGVRLISLQKNEGLEQLNALPAPMKVETLGDDFDAGDDAFLDAAAVIEALDLVISSDTSIAHLAGALGRPTWVALKSVPDWRWLLDRPDSPWYPTMRLFRQQTRDDWRERFSHIESALRGRLQARGK